MDHKISKDMISSGMIPSGEKTQADLSRIQYGSAPSPSSLMDAYKSIYEHHQKDADGKVIEHDEKEELNEGKMPEGLKNYLMKKGKKKDDKDMKEMYGGGAGTTPKPNPNTTAKKPGLLQRMKNRTAATNQAINQLNQDVDLFDIVKGMLIDEGSSEEEALKIMVNMSQEDFEKLKEEITLTRGDYGSRNVPTSAYAVGKKKGFKGYKAGGGLGPDFLPLPKV